MKRTNGVKKNSPTAILKPRQNALSRKRSRSLHSKTHDHRHPSFLRKLLDESCVGKEKNGRSNVRLSISLVSFQMGLVRKCQPSVAGFAVGGQGKNENRIRSLFGCLLILSFTSWTPKNGDLAKSCFPGRIIVKSALWEKEGFQPLTARQLMKGKKAVCVDGGLLSPSAWK